jgi:hypothetical protein
MRVFALGLGFCLGCTVKEDASRATRDTGSSGTDGDTSADDSGDDPGDDTGPDSGAPLYPPCGDAAGSLPDGLTTLSWDDGEGYTSVPEQDWDIGGEDLSTTRLFEAVRFQFDSPARIHGFTVEFGALPDGADTPVFAGVYPDFGHNGFDFWRFDPLWDGSLCAGDLTEDGQATYVLAEPLEVSQPGLVYVAHERQAGEAAWNFDISGAGTGGCGGFDVCHSALNLPDLRSVTTGGVTTSFWNGYSFSLQYDFIVRLHVELLDEIAPEDKRFQRVEDLSLSTRLSWGDYDSDGDDDLFMSGPVLFRNDDGVFTDVTGEAGLGGAASGGGIWGDFDNDGCLDLFAFVESGSADDTLMHNQCDGTFVDVTKGMGISDEQSYNDCAGAGWTRAPTTAAAWWDVDGDGFLDLYLSNFNCWTDYSHFTDRVWHNVGGTLFEEWTGTRGFYGDDDYQTAGRGASPIDYDQDGDIDIFVNNYVLERNLFYDNLGDGIVEERGRDADVAGHPYEVGWSAYYGHTIGAAWGDLDNDGDFDLVAANLAHPRFWDFSDKTQILIQEADGSFTDIQGDWETAEGAAGLRYQETHSVPVLGDFDNDGALDLAITATYDGRPTDFYWGRGDGRFDLDVHTTGIDLTGGWGVAAADADGDGDLDLATSGGLYLNTGPLDNHWLQIRAVGNVHSNRAAIGATIRITAGDQNYVRHVSGGNGQGGQDSQTVHFGLSDETTVTTVEIDFPGSETVTFTGPFDADQRLYLFEDGRIETD